MSGFETFTLNWYQAHVNRFTFDGGLVPGLIEKLKLKGLVQDVFFKAMEKIYLTLKRVDSDKQRSADEAVATRLRGANG